MWYIMVMVLFTWIGFLLMVGLLFVLAHNPGKLAPLKDGQGKQIEGSISKKVWMSVNGTRQGMFIRGENAQNPVVLYLHGGPGSPLLQFITYLENDVRLEQYFTVCYWD